MVSPLEKVFADQRPSAITGEPELSGFLGENLSIQVAALPPSVQSLSELPTVRLTLHGDLVTRASSSLVELVPVMLPAFDGHDDGYLRDSPGLYPDLLRPLQAGQAVTPTIGAWFSWWLDVQVDDAAQAGRHELTVRVEAVESSEVLFETTLVVNIYPSELPPLDIVNTHWLHVDSLAEYYDVDVFSEEHWRILDRFVQSASEMGANSLLTPVWTPPLDTAVGSTRLRVQLIDISDDATDGYSFSFEKLGRWIEMCRTHGITTLEIAHLFTQWGASATPAIYVDTEDGTEQRFGWHVSATDPAYRRLLASLIPQLREYLEQNWSDGSVIFHVSDEPEKEMLPNYQAARAVVDDLLDGAVIVDALSDYAFASSGAVDVPVVATDAVEPFLADGSMPFWVYHCVAQHRDVANRFISQPGVRTRVIGRQIFAAGAQGFLHWGFNFYGAHHSTHPIDPYRDTTAGGAFPSGDPFIVYPSPDGTALPSIRYRLFAQAMADHRALQLLRTMTDHATASALIDEDGTLSFSTFDYDQERHISRRKAVDRAILDHS